MAIKTTAEQLEEIQDAISKVMSGQDITIDGKRLTRANLRDLTTREEILLTRYKSETGTGGMAMNYGVVRREY